MKKIQRIEIGIEPSQKIKIPFNSEILGLDLQDGKPGFNVLVQVGQQAQDRTIVITTFEKELSATSNRTKFLGSFRLKKDIFFVFDE